MKKIVITMELGKLEARYDDGEVLRGGDDTAFLGRLEVDPGTISNYMRSEQISGFLDSVVWPQLNSFAREIETEQNEKEEAEIEASSGEAP